MAWRVLARSSAAALWRHTTAAMHPRQTSTVLTRVGIARGPVLLQGARATSTQPVHPSLVPGNTQWKRIGVGSLAVLGAMSLAATIVEFSNVTFELPLGDEAQFDPASVFLGLTPEDSQEEVC